MPYGGPTVSYGGAPAPPHHKKHGNSSFPPVRLPSLSPPSPEAQKGSGELPDTNIKNSPTALLRWCYGGAGITIGEILGPRKLGERRHRIEKKLNNMLTKSCWVDGIVTLCYHSPTVSPTAALRCPTVGPSFRSLSLHF